MPSNNISHDLLTKEQVAELLGVCTRTVERWHVTKTGPARIKFGRNIRYREAAVREWLLAQEQEVRS